MNDIIIITICLFLSPTVPAEGLKIWGAHGKRRSFEGIGLLFLFLPNLQLQPQIRRPAPMINFFQGQGNRF